ncbi:hypothetical protein [uncultured Sulfitobacter sp.]|uniref:hypothetical protein n=1 Tax=uncultured Sulfitobacter sp. TaxID=191468 RepID=UPI002630BE53|nr:hypothetical protein [uncultured Sulfitobacter sp.]
MDMESVTLRLPRQLLSGAQRVATARDVTIGHMVRQLLKREVERQLQAGGAAAPTDDRLLIALRALLSRDFAKASDWTDLAARLRMHGYELRRSNDGLVIYKSSCGTRVCRISDIGVNDMALTARFQSTPPGSVSETTATGTMPAGRLDPVRTGRIAEHMAQAQNWSDLQARLAQEGMELRALGAGLGIYNSATGRHMCNSASVGARYQTLTKRFGAAMPGHPQDMSHHLATRSDGQDAQTQQGTAPDL